MGLVESFRNIISGNRLAAPDSKDLKKSLRMKVEKRLYNVDLLLKNWRTAKDTALNPQRPKREMLYALYDAVMLDDRLLSQVRTARFTVQMSAFSIKKNDTEIKDLHELFESKWFFRYLELCVDTELYGHSLIEFYKEGSEDYFSSVEIIPRAHVVPQQGIVVMRPSDDKGIDYRNNKMFDRLVEIGSPDDLGLLLALSKLVIRKDYSLTDWSRRNERFGMPFVAVKTASRDKAELDAKEEMLKNLGANGYAILDDMDTVEFKESFNQAGHLTFKEMLKYCDEGIAMLVNGQTSTSDQKAYVGAAEVHERILNDYTLARMRRIQNHINDDLIPFLVRNNYPLDGTTFHFHDLMEEDKEKNAPPDPIDPKKKKVDQQQLNNLMLSFFDNFDSNHLYYSPLAFDLLGAFNKLIRKIFDRDITSGKIDKETFLENSKDMFSEIESGFGSTLTTSSFRDGTTQLLQRMRRNTFTFIAFKNHSNITQMVEALKDQNGKLRTWSEFKKAAMAISDQYNKNWLQAEWQTARTSAKMANKWLNIEARKHLLPWLEYKTQDDDKVRHDHALLHNTMKKVDDPFWDTYYPPNGWRCRCYVLQHADGTDKDPEGYPDEKAMPPAFRNNPGKSGKVFDDKHPYFVTQKDDKEKIHNAMTNIVTSDFRKNNKVEGKSFRVADIEFKMSASTIKRVTGKPHKDKLTRLDVLSEADFHLENAIELKPSADSKGNPIELWRYFLTEYEGQNFYWNFAKTYNGWILKAITDVMKK